MSRRHDRIRRALFDALTGPLGVAPDAPVLEDALRLETPRDAAHGDVTSPAAMRLPKLLKRPPRDIARDLVDALAQSGALENLVEKTDVAGAGFVNFTLSRTWVENAAAEAYADARLGLEPAAEPRNVVIDFSAPNVAKPMHVGHIRSTILGDSLGRVLRLLGHKVIGDNHLGDWGTQFGMILHGIRSKGLDAEVATLTVDEIETIYREISDRCERDETTAEAARAEVVKLHEGDVEALRIWRAVMKTSLAELDATYARLGVTFDVTLGESFYNDVLTAVVDDLEAKGIARESDGALVVFYEEDKYPPFLVRKRDGAFLYAATDFATVRHRVETWQADWMIYVVDARQQLHFNQLFEACRMWGYADVRFEHPWFGSILGEDGKPFRTRAGGVVRLSDLLDEAERRALAVVVEKSPHLDDATQRNIARAVGIGALKYADLSQNRTSDYVFSWDKMLSLSGNTAPYMQYMFARVRSIFRKGGTKKGTVPFSERREKGTVPSYCLDTPAELALAKGLIAFGEAVELVAEQLRPSFLSTYLYDLAGRFSTFYDQCPVLKAETDDLRESRLMLCDHTARVIELGLNLLGIDVVEQM